MDIELLKTFLEVRSARHFGKAASKLNITQAAVSIRIRQLEKMLDAPLFIRFRNNLMLTETGERLVFYAENILNQWEKARQEIGQRKSNKKTIRFGATNGFCSILLKNSLAPIYGVLSDVSLRVESHDEETLRSRLREKRIDLALLYDLSKETALISRPISSVELVMVSTTKGESSERALQGDYVTVEWGSFFNSRFLLLSSQMHSPVLQATDSGFALQFLLDHGGCAYLPYRLVEEYLGSGLYLVNDAQTLHQPIYAIYNRSSPHAVEMETLIDVIADRAEPRFARLEDVIAEAGQGPLISMESLA